MPKSKRSQQALDRAVEAAQERHVRIWNAQIKRMEEAERKRRAAAERAETKAAAQRAKIRRVK